MIGIVKYHTTVTTVQLVLIILSLCVSSLGVLINHPYLIYSWYLGLFCIAMMLATSMIIAVTLVLNHIFKSDSRQSQRGLSAPKRIEYNENNHNNPAYQGR
jgi:lysylphosphatidylglycerol synthetase-like protein (DUF2156 family)